MLLWNARYALNCRQENVCLDQYWVDFWLTSYADGHLRRGLLGQAVRAFSDGTVTWLTLNIVAATLAVSTLALVYVRYFCGRPPQPNWRAAVFLVVAGPPTMVVLATLGDPLHAALLVVLGTCVATESLPRGAAVAMMVLAGIVAALIHEASIALLWPVVLAAALWRSGRVLTLPKSLACVAVASGALLVLVNAPSAGRSLNGVIQWGGDEYHAASTVLPPIMSLVRVELAWAFGSPLREVVVELLQRIAGVLAYPVVTLLLLRSLADRGVVRIYVILFLSSLPLYVAATDWGRFSMYTLLAALVLARVPSMEQGCVLPGRVERALDRFGTWAMAWVAPTGALVVLPLIGYASHSYTDAGLAPRGVAFIVAAVLLTRAVAGGSDAAETTN